MAFKTVLIHVRDGIFDKPGMEESALLNRSKGIRKNYIPGPNQPAQHMPPMIVPTIIIIGMGWAKRWWLGLALVGQLVQSLPVWAYFYNFWVTAGTGGIMGGIWNAEGDFKSKP